MKIRVVRCFGVLGVALLASCGSERVSGPNAPVGRYSLTLVDNDALPTLIWTETPTRYVLVSETLTFDGFGGVTRRRTDRFENTQTGEIETKLITYRVQYRVRDGTIEIGSFKSCGPAALCAANDTGALSQGQILLKSIQFANRSQLTYRKEGS